ncbi:hypothetical protein [Streptomyces vietnamensis]|uniref:Uncharacterized protein n=1 Tax=Streptomyces vietnamensis TaxID=362257 RepID=A0A0B5IIZ7_9ACTN|nr:hypothetical protein [Streptomyces vietnamensis]AJF70447.1 hypothetical protein SVTN_40495 [Streptomyces vietnamensis]
MSDYEYEQLREQAARLSDMEAMMEEAANRNGRLAQEWHNLQYEHQSEINAYLEEPGPELPGIHE